MDEQIVIMDVQTRRTHDLLYLALVFSEEYSLLPELYEIFGQETLVKFLDLFSGAQITVPPRRVFEHAVRDVNIYVRMTDSRSKKRQDNTAARLADEYEISEATIRRIFSAMVEKCEGLYELRGLLHDK